MEVESGYSNIKSIKVQSGWKSFFFAQANKISLEPSHSPNSSAGVLMNFQSFPHSSARRRQTL